MTKHPAQHMPWLAKVPDALLSMPSAACAQVLGLMELEVLRNSVVGLPGINGLSVEQRKRLTIGVELVANPCES